MTISYPLSMPTDPCPNRIDWVQKVAVTVSRSPFTYKAQIIEHAGDGWGVSVGYPIMDRAQMAPFAAWLAALRGPFGTFLFGDTLLSTPRGVATGTPLLQGASVPGLKFLTIDGFTHNVTGIIKAGDFFQVGNSLYMALKDASSDNSGGLQVDVFPSCRAHPDNTPVVFNNPKCLMRLVETQQTPFSADDSQLYSFGFTAEEAL